MKDAVQITMTDVINRLHHLKGEDRFHLLMEYMEWLCLEDEMAQFLYCGFFCTGLQSFID